MGFNAQALSTMSLIGQVGGAVTSAAGSYFGAATQRQNLYASAAIAEAQARIAEVNARQSDLAAESALAQGQHQVGQLTLQAGQLKGRQRTALAANGVDLGQGNAAEIQASADILKEVDMNTLTANALRTAWGHRTESLNLRGKAASHRMEAASARANAKAIKPGLALGTSLIGSATTIASYWANKAEKGGGSNTTLTGAEQMANQQVDVIGSYIKLKGL